MKQHYRKEGLVQGLKVTAIANRKLKIVNMTKHSFKDRGSYLLTSSLSSFWSAGSISIPPAL